ncbi:cyclophane-forming radical SAM/SPASM peptide maturase YhhB [Pseudomonas aeruginosa]|uniref:cyclophane-forming radical SAM/SPASM peptide maturase YhhB n=1 Tax=Pseudomonas aeruginosa TaxID=287 RepID=UPI000F624F28|nr:cyclophane-forming radical SAM/SPASM peptide maturase YhhB [Pseudomonas aeruginosa]RRH85420.1 FxsB family radical SAM/SPASM domain protein [Pseudomonas aeruginosa]HCW1033987.1 FxsB family radical SAM/SPASM domain protein [Pseudomonas aeruginosa]HCW1045680.1 FxsB family radical SAM/SPASM domain protein [Pseudomonas aeruginosa]HDY5503636.1 FxsB family radical SAM/SPASM domain protein [Pseudomonas aeruginosa]
MDAPAIFSSFLVKVASRCNLDCDYCYVYHHADQSWRSMPKLLTQEHRVAFAERLAEYAAVVGLERCAVIFHGGEPLLAGAAGLAEFAELLRATVPIPVDISLQSNGLLLSDNVLDTLEAADIGISLSLDGPRAANDRHRLTKKGRSSFVQTEAALKRLESRPSLFAGVIAVVDPITSPDELFEYFSQFSIPRLDFLLPDAHWQRPPPGRNTDPGLYEEWLIRAFDLWLDRYAHIPVRTFESLLDAATGLSSGTDAFGFGDVSLLSIETDGTYHDLDVLKVTQDGATRLFGGVVDTPIADVAGSAQINRHRSLLRKEGLSSKCQDCDVVEICGGGSLPHRFNGAGLGNPTVYCGEMKRLVKHVLNRLQEFVDAEPAPPPPLGLPEYFNLAEFECAETAAESIKWLHEEAIKGNTQRLTLALQATPNNDSAHSLLVLPSHQLEMIATHPGAFAWAGATIAACEGRTVLSVDGQQVAVGPNYLDHLEMIHNEGTLRALRIGEQDEWLRAGFGDAISFNDEAICAIGKDLVAKALEIVGTWRPTLLDELLLACSAIQFITDTTAHPEKIVSFSDNSVPGALYVSIVQGDSYIDPYDLADSLIHEHRHQKLYLLERRIDLIESTATKVVSPWREDLRPPSGLLHAIFVFVELRRFWIYAAEHGPARIYKRAINQITDTDTHLQQAFETIKSCPLTPWGEQLVAVLASAAREGELSVKGETGNARKEGKATC